VFAVREARGKFEAEPGEQLVQVHALQIVVFLIVHDDESTILLGKLAQRGHILRTLITAIVRTETFQTK
jgi:hypothetical protein